MTRALPNFAFVTSPNGDVLEIERGSLGARTVDTDMTADQLNDYLGLSRFEVAAMDAGRRFGFMSEEASIEYQERKQ